MIDAETPRKQRIRKRKPCDKERRFSVGEDVASSIAQGVGAILAIVAVPLCIVKAVSDGGELLLALALLYTVPMLLWTVASVLRHALQHDTPRRVFTVLDHCFAAVFMGSLCTMYLLTIPDLVIASSLVGAVWVICLAAILAELFWKKRPVWVLPALFVLFGVVFLAAVPSLAGFLDPVLFGCLMIGALLWLVGLFFYRFGREVPYLHFVFHILMTVGMLLLFFPTLLGIL